MKSKISSVILITADDTQLEEIAVTHCQNQEEPKCSEFTRTHTHAIKYYKLLRSSLDCNPHGVIFTHAPLQSLVNRCRGTWLQLLNLTEPRIFKSRHHQDESDKTEGN